MFLKKFILENFNNDEYVLTMGYLAPDPHEPDPEDALEEPFPRSRTQYKVLKFNNLDESIRAFQSYISSVEDNEANDRRGIRTGSMIISHISLTLHKRDNNKFGLTRPIDIAYWNRGNPVQFGIGAQGNKDLMGALKMYGHGTRLLPNESGPDDVTVIRK